MADEPLEPEEDDAYTAALVEGMRDQGRGVESTLRERWESLVRIPALLAQMRRERTRIAAMLDEPVEELPEEVAFDGILETTGLHADTLRDVVARPGGRRKADDPLNEPERRVEAAMPDLIARTPDNGKLLARTIGATVDWMRPHRRRAKQRKAVEPRREWDIKRTHRPKPGPDDLVE